jgi:hypothetical protein
MEENNNEDLSSLFGGNTTAIDIFKKLLDPDNIVIKTQTDMDKIRVLLKIKWIAEIKKSINKEKPVMEIFQDEIIPYYLSLMCSLNRQSRTEIINGLKNMNERYIEKEQGLNNLFGGKK